jgi:hypothetical protein
MGKIFRATMQNILLLPGSPAPGRCRRNSSLLSPRKGEREDGRLGAGVTLEPDNPSRLMPPFLSSSEGRRSVITSLSGAARGYRQKKKIFEVARK